MGLIEVIQQWFTQIIKKFIIITQVYILKVYTNEIHDIYIYPLYTGLYYY